MSNSIHHANDTLHDLRKSVEDLNKIRRQIRKFTANTHGQRLDVQAFFPKTHELLSACLADLIESCAHLSQGDDEDRLQLASALASHIIEEDVT